MLTHDGKLVTDEAIKYVYAAYRRGALPLPEGLDAQSFEEHPWLGQILDQGGQILVLSGFTPIGFIPVGLAIIDYSNDSATPEVFWFPEASPRNKVECGLRFLLDLKKDHRIFITVPGHPREPTQDWKYLAHLCKYGVLRPVGTIHGQYGDKKHGTLFQSVN